MVFFYRTATATNRIALRAEYAAIVRNQDEGVVLVASFASRVAREQQRAAFTFEL